MTTYRKMLFVLVPVLFIAGCAGVTAALKQTSTEAHSLQADLVAKVDAGKAMVDSMPDGAAKDKLEKALDAARASLVTMGDKLAQADQMIDSLNQGVIPPQAIAAATAIPVVGPYVPLAAILLPVVFGLIKSGQAGKYKDGFVKVVQSWEQVGAELTDAEKQAVASIQGAKVTALVHDVKAKL